jgi:hypothetical protein
MVPAGLLINQINFIVPSGTIPATLLPAVLTVYGSPPLSRYL